MIHIDLEKGAVCVDGQNGPVEHAIGTPEAFAIISRAWLRSGWDNKHVYSFSWLGRPIIQLPEDMFRLQEVIYSIKPDVIIETGVAHGGSLVFYAGLCQAIGHGRIIGIDIEIRPHNRRAIEAHELFRFITLVEGSSIAPEVVAQVKAMVKPGEKVLVVLDSNHTCQHVLGELRAYSGLVSPGSYIIAADGIMAELVGAPRSHADWASNNPQGAVRLFLQENRDFELSHPPFAFNEGSITQPVTYWPNGWLRRIR